MMNRRFQAARSLLSLSSQQKQQLHQQQHYQWFRQSSLRLYRSSPLLLSEENAAAAATDEKAAQEAAASAAALQLKQQRKLAARDFNQRRAQYKRQVSVMRRKYAEQISRERAADKAEQEALERELTRKRLERQRRKNVQSAQNAIRQEEIRLQREQEFQEHLQRMQEKRDREEQLLTAARQKVIDELEKEAPLWLSTPEEVEAAFTPEAEQLLWARPGGVLGAPNPSLDAHFWQYETHTWHMTRTYKSMREVLMEEIEEAAYEEANVDSRFWTEERTQEHERLETKARLRNMVRLAGRIELLKKQRQMIVEQSVIAEGEVPRPQPAANLKFLHDNRALEREGARLLLEDPTKFFRFESSTTDAVFGTKDPAFESSGSTSSYAGPTLGSPVALRDPLREDSNDGKSVFPRIIGRYPKPDTRTEREKKQQEREEKLWAAAQAQALETTTSDVDLAAQDQEMEDLEPDLNYDEMEWDSDDEEWKKGLDPVVDAHKLNLPPEKRYKDSDIDWVVEQLESKVHFLEQQFEIEMENLKQKTQTELRLQAEQDGESTASGLDEGSLEAAVLALPEKELLALSDLDDQFADNMDEAALAEAAADIPGLTLDQIKAIVTRDR